MAENPDSGVTIGRLAEQAGVHLETIRFYQRLGLMPTPRRAHGTVRRYGKDALSRLRFIKRAQALSFSLDEVNVLLRLSVGKHCMETRMIAEQKNELIKKKIAHLRRIQAALDRLILACRSGRKGRGCPLIESL